MCFITVRGETQLDGVNGGAKPRFGVVVCVVSLAVIVKRAQKHLIQQFQMKLWFLSPSVISHRWSRFKT